MSEQTDQNVEHIKKGYEAFAAGDVETLMSLFDDTTAGGEAAQDAGVYTLRDGKIVRAELYGDTAMMERVYGKKQVAAQ
jgi:ketosteroid isomerase-like protein